MCTDGLAYAALVPTVRVLVLGDSLSEGVGDPAPGSRGRLLHGWVHHLRELAAGVGVDLQPVVLARRGAHVGHVVFHQLAEVPEGHYDVAVLLVGFNDVVHRELDVARFARGHEVAAAELAVRAPVFVLGTLHDLTRTLPLPSGLRAVVRRNIADVNTAVRATAARSGALLLDLEALQGRVGRSTISVDLLHPTRSGHQQIAAEVARLLAGAGVLPPAGPVEPGREPVSARVAAEGRHLLWLLRDGGPWLVGDLWRRTAARLRDRPGS